MTLALHEDNLAIEEMERRMKLRQKAGKADPRSVTMRGFFTDSVIALESRIINKRVVKFTGRPLKK